MQNVLQTTKATDDFFTWFEDAANNNMTAAKFLVALCQDYANPGPRVEQIHDLEHRGDTISHSVYEQLNKIFMPPLDPEDIIALTRALDDVMDYIHAAADAMYVYAIPQPTPVAQELAGIILACTEEVAHNLPHLRQRRTMRQLQPAIIELNRLENQADTVLRQALIDLFHHPHDPQEVLAWSIIYELMEDVTDKSEDIADVLSGLLIKYA